jgi:hypothetical protein
MEKIETKLCSKCGKEKDVSCFYKRRYAHLDKNWCRQCVIKSGYWKEHYQKYAEHQKELKRQYYKENPEMFKAARKKYYRKNREKILAQQKERYFQNPDLQLRRSLAASRIDKLNCSCSLDELYDWYNKQFAEQKGCCAICGRHESEFKTRFHIDHDHKTGKRWRFAG